MFRLDYTAPGYSPSQAEAFSCQRPPAMRPIPARPRAARAWRPRAKLLLIAVFAVCEASASLVSGDQAVVACESGSVRVPFVEAGAPNLMPKRS